MWRNLTGLAMSRIWLAGMSHGQTMNEIVTDLPDPDCPHCNGTGVRGGCFACHLNPGKFNHMHTYSFCECVNERKVEVDDEQ